MKRLTALLLLLIGGPVLAGTCNVTEFPFVLPIDPNGNPVPVITLTVTGPTSQTVTYTTSTASASAFAATTLMIRISCDANAHFQLGASPTATTSDIRIAAGSTEYFNLIPGQVSGGDIKIAFYDGTS